MSERTKHQIVCVGLAEAVPKEGKKSKAPTLLPMFREVVDGVIVDDSQSLLWGGVKASPGNLYEVEAGTWEPGGAHVIYHPKGGRLRWLRRWHIVEDCREWQAQAEALEALREQTKLRANAERRDELTELLAPIQAVYDKLSWTAKTAFIVEMMRRLERRM